MLTPFIRQLEVQIVQIEQSGPVASTSARLDISTHAKSGHEYARLRDGDVLTSCGRVGSEKYLEVLATLQRRDKIAELKQAISSLKQAEAIPVIIPAVGKLAALAEPAMAKPSEVMAMSADAIAATANVTETALAAKPKAKTKSKSKPAAAPKKKKAKGRKQLYTHVKTRQGTVVHAVLGKDKIGEWRTPALCGATPPKRDRMGWEFPTHDDGVTCPKCYRKLPANGKRHLPVF